MKTTKIKSHDRGRWNHVDSKGVAKKSIWIGDSIENPGSRHGPRRTYIANFLDSAYYNVDGVANAARACACANALDGIENPAAFVETFKQMQAALKQALEVKTLEEGRLAIGEMMIVYSLSRKVGPQA